MNEPEKPWLTQVALTVPSGFCWIVVCISAMYAFVLFMMATGMYDPERDDFADPGDSQFLAKWAIGWQVAGALSAVYLWRRNKQHSGFFRIIAWIAAGYTWTLLEMATLFFMDLQQEDRVNLVAFRFLVIWAAGWQVVGVLSALHLWRIRQLTKQNQLRNPPELNGF
jgi:hypothetical protein